MELMVSDKAAKWYKDELNLQSGDGVRFFVRYGGFNSLQSGFSLGVSIEKPVESAIKVEEEGITFFVEEADIWYFDNHNLKVAFDEKKEEPEFEYIS
ncbi:HesB/YadR/YfhF family protein [Bacillus luteolus]|uniref:HesB/YadR/YfhF family protein n=1 Tax=Litchfieldia luteola TaxID=682179 RepID=A0ABR9QJD1_9BACI|nr:HesB/YadR/YfhF family protein [Cytobacillus luteolus]MBE4908602.1 HesB/YadR/YfhF family protein [Cytobacillus luteolus]MBP1941457.1 uncharacterized protein YneR [Cytobacillus luteolus]